MSYATKYSFTYTDVFGVVSVVNLKLKDYASTVFSLGQGGIKYEFGRDRAAGVVRGSSATIGLWQLTQGQWAEFRNITDKKWMVEHIKDSVPYWYGWLTPEIFSEPFKKSLPYRIELTAIDGLGDLANIDYLDSAGAMLTTREAFKTIIGRCLKASKLDLNMVFSVGIHPVGMTGDIFDQCTYSNAALVDKDGKVLKCSDVLERFRPLGITIKQWKGKWYILRTADLIDAVNVYEYDSAGTFVDDYSMELDSVINDTTDTGSVNLPIADSGILSQNPAYKEKEISIDFGKKISFLLNHNFANDFSAWTQSLSGYSSIYALSDIKFCSLSYQQIHAAMNVSQSCTVKANSDDFSISYKVAAFGWVSSGGGRNSINMNYKMRVKLVGSSTYYLSQTAGWVSADTYITGTILSSTTVGAPKWNDITILTYGFPIDGTLTVELHNPAITSLPAGWGTSNYTYGVGFTNLILMQAGEAYLTGTTLKCVNNEDFNNVPSKEELFIGDCPNVANSAAIYANFIGNASNVPTTLWAKPGTTPTYTLAELFLREEISLHVIPQFRLSITIKGRFDWCGTVSDKEGNVYELVSATLNERDQQWTLELARILPYTSGAVVTTVTSTSGSSSGGSGSSPGGSGVSSVDVSEAIALMMGIANGLATLDSSTKVPAAQLPSYVDDVIEYANLSAFPLTGESGKIYVALDTNLTYRWGGSSYTQISPTDHNHSNKSALDNVSGTNTGDETTETIKTKLGISILSGDNTGDQDVSAMTHSNRAALDSISGTNTGDETASTIKTKLGISTLSGSNTGDETTSTIKTKLGISTLSGSNTGDQDISAMTHSNRAALDNVSGTNTGDETTSTIKTKLGISTLSGSNTGDQDISAITDATSENTAGKIVKRDANGSFKTGKQEITANASNNVFELKNAAGVLKWYLTINSDVLQFRNASGTIEATLDQSGNLKAKGEITAYATI
ncbi:MAG: hypothetical protein JZU65_06070 [Chlorobium sp.]|nr:hypothetical protein [Chlorobium sp.]